VGRLLGYVFMLAALAVGGYLVLCLQAGSGANVQHMNGPNENAPIAGPC
jgi:hypothetical protein